jgi:hypothetical protein
MKETARRTDRRKLRVCKIRMEELHLCEIRIGLAIMATLAPFATDTAALYSLYTLYKCGP